MDERDPPRVHVDPDHERAGRIIANTGPKIAVCGKVTPPMGELTRALPSARDQLRDDRGGVAHGGHLQ